MAQPGPNKPNTKIRFLDLLDNRRENRVDTNTFLMLRNLGFPEAEFGGARPTWTMVREWLALMEPSISIWLHKSVPVVSVEGEEGEWWFAGANLNVYGNTDFTMPRCKDRTFTGALAGIIRIVVHNLTIGEDSWQKEREEKRKTEKKYRRNDP